jgi:hypothetical protein
MSKEVVVYKTEGQLQADLVVAFLKSNGINSYASMESAGAAFGLQGGFLGRARVYVLEEDQAEAERLLEEMEDGELILPEDVDLDESFSEDVDEVIDDTEDTENEV